MVAKILTVNSVQLKKNPQIIVATPGRLMDHMDRGSIKFEDVKIVVLDEADEMLNSGFVDDINKILGGYPRRSPNIAILCNNA